MMMNRNYQNMTRAELIAELERRAPPSKVESLQSELTTHQEELRAHLDELHNTQTLLEASRDEYVQLYDFAPVPYLTLDPSGIVTAINLTGCTLLETERARILNYPLTAFVDEPHRQQFLDHMRRCRQNTEHVSTELTLKTRSGKKVPALIMSQHSGATEYRTVVFDRTEQLRMDRAIREANASLEERVKDRTAELVRTNERLQQEIDQRMRAEAEIKEASNHKDEFLAMLGHELRNPLGPIRNGAALMQLVDGDRDKIREVSEMIERQVQHMTRIVDDLLDISRISRGKIGLLREPLNLNQLVRQTVADVRTSLERENLVVHVDVSDEPIWISGDPVRMTQILGNLLHNARKFSNAGGEVSVRLRYLPALDEALLVISDTGIGIDAELLEHVFEPFRQADRSLDRSRGGLGLGLALVRGLIDLHGGSIAATSSGAGKGAQFTIRLPVIPAPASTLQPAGSESSQPQSLRILIIEDQADTAQTMQKLLTTLGHEVYTALNGEDGLRLAQEKHPRVIFSDIGLPGMNGYDVAKRLRADQPGDKLSMIAVTGYGRDEDMRLALSAGFDRHLVKPIRFADLQRLLKSL